MFMLRKIEMKLSTISNCNINSNAVDDFLSPCFSTPVLDD